ncbi:MAG: hypothetical protein PUE33_04230 [bacterium]|nr:hypothetical protein [bacterium]
MQKSNKKDNNDLDYLKKEIEKLKEENRKTKIRLERKSLELQKYWLKILDF